MKFKATKNLKLTSGQFWQKGDEYAINKMEARALLSDHGDAFEPTDDEAKELAKEIAGNPVWKAESVKVFGGTAVIAEDAAKGKK